MRFSRIMEPLIGRNIGADYLELGMQRTEDGVLVALQDYHEKGITRRNLPDRAEQTLAEFTYAELMQVNAGSWYDKVCP